MTRSQLFTRPPAAMRFAWRRCREQTTQATRRHRRRRTRVLCLVLALAGTAAWGTVGRGDHPPEQGGESSGSVAHQPALRIVTSSPRRDRRHVEVVGLPPEVLSHLRSAELDERAWRRILAVRIESRPGQAALPMLGAYSVDGDRIVFQPRFPLRPGATYHVEFALEPSTSRWTRAIRLATSIEIPALRQPDRTVVRHVYPSAPELPENLLKFYIHFSRPMSRGDSYRHIRLLDERGQAVDSPFLELGEELWDHSGKRLTLLFDPGRIKRGLRPREEMGPVLEAGHHYALVIDQAWRDADSIPLGESYVKNFHALPPDESQPDPAAWELVSPAPGTAQALTLHLSEPLDHAMLQRVIRVTDSTNGDVSGRLLVDERETRLRFVPDNPWRPGAYQVRVETSLEDLAGNSIGRPFEVDLWHDQRAEGGAAVVVLPFEVAHHAIEHRPDHPSTSP